jgi:hypothetical protein
LQLGDRQCAPAWPHGRFHANLSAYLAATLLQAAGEVSRWELEATIWKPEKEQKELSAKASRLTQANSVLLEEAKNLKVQLIEP